MRAVSVPGLQQEVALSRQATDGSTPSCAGRGSPATGGSPRQTPCLPWNVSGNRAQRMATDFACFYGFWDDRICDQLPPVATTGLHKGSIRGLPDVEPSIFDELGSRRASH